MNHKLVGEVRLELTTTAVSGRDSTPTELFPYKVELFRTSTNPIFYKWGYDLIYYCNYILVRREGFEPPTSWS